MFHMITKHDSLAKRIILLAFTTISLSIILTGSIIVWNFQKSQERNLNTYLTAYIDTFIAATTIDKQGLITVSNDVTIFQNMPFYWQITANGNHLKKSSLIEKPINIDNLANGISSIYIEDKNTYITMAIKHLTFPGNKKVTYLFGIQSEIAAALMNEERSAFVGSLFLVLIVLAFFLIITIALIQVRATTKPLQKIKQEIIDIHKGKQTKLGTHFPKEIALLAKEVNTLISYNLSIIERYSIFAANLSHALKTPLTVINNEAQKSSSILASTVKDKIADMLGLIDRNLARVKAASAHKTLVSHIDVMPIITKITASFGKLYSKKIDIVQSATNPLFQGNESDIYEVLGNIIENGCKYSKSLVQVTLSSTEKELVIIIEDDGPGIAEDKLEDALKYGTRLDQTKPGSGIGMAVTSDIILLYNGKLELNRSDLGGLHVKISLPFVS